MVIYQKLSIDSVQSLSRFQWLFKKIEIEKTLLKFIWNHRIFQIVKEIQRKKNKAKGITLPDFKLYYKTIVTKIKEYWHKNNRTKKQNLEPRNNTT